MRFSALGLLVIFSFFIKAQPLHFKTFTKKDGLPAKTVSFLLEDDRGFIWVGTLNGLTRYDGNPFLSIERIRYPAYRILSILRLRLPPTT